MIVNQKPRPKYRRRENENATTEAMRTFPAVAVKETTTLLRTNSSIGVWYQAWIRLPQSKREGIHSGGKSHSRPWSFRAVVAIQKTGNREAMAPAVSSR